MFLSRVKNFLNRARWIGRFTGGPLSAALFMIFSRFNNKKIAKGNYQGTEFLFRRNDLSGLKEILIDEEYSFLKNTLKKKSSINIIDVGAHIGLPIIWASTINPHINVFSIEASPETYKVLEKNIKLSRHVSWRSIHAAAWKDIGPIRFQTIGDSMSHRTSETGDMEINGITLEMAIDQSFPNQIIDVMKIDIEGAEEAFLSLDPSTLKNVQTLVIELHPQLCDTEKVKELLSSSFPQIQIIPNRISSKPLLYCQKLTSTYD